MEDLPRVTVEHPLDRILEHLEYHDAVLVESPHGLQAVGTAHDVLKYFYNVARPFVLLQEIELSLREIIRERAPGDRLAECVGRSIRQKYEMQGRPLPTNLSDMEVEDYGTIICSSANWSLFEPVFGSNLPLVKSKFKRVRTIRNAVFDFRDSVSIQDHETLAATRHWLFDKLRTFRAQEGESR